ncbi:acetate--CoA ligase [Variovorax sp. WS11]|uniref:acetate--CoA ligase n=1 Tax=Variovorax sp. WS11 TaxID=1105204 RepID=UPI000D0D03F8|nr:acetate--CoA ligase [Variovorax sp. WS11]NDZ16914.1 acetate--CoA ligase [Variovorax sp. WS11]PSL81354.1 acetate--CoA ligase [Variovorax sp. WS11]
MANNELIFPVPHQWKRSAWMDEPTYRKAYERSLREPDEFWAEQAQSLTWVKRPTEIRDVSFVPGDLRIRWFGDGVLNASVNCVDRHLHDGARPAIIWEGDDPAESRTISYAELHAEVCRLANGLKAIGVAKGDRVVIYLPMVPEAAVAMLACARIGAIYSVVFAGFSPDAIAGRIQDCNPRILITADEGVRAGRRLPMKANADQALRQCPGVRTCIVLRRTGAPTSWTEGRDLWYHSLTERQPSSCEPEPMGAEDPLFILYTSGSTGKPKGVLHTTGGYLLAASLTHKFVLDYHLGDVFWCTADIGWVTGHSYIVYGPLANGATTVMFEGVPNHPDSARFWQVIDKHRVSIFYTSPTAIRSLMRDRELPVRRSSRASLRLLGTVGEPINPEAWLWYYNVVGQARCPIVDTWWQTETGAIVIAPLPGAIATKPGSATLPFFGVEPVIVDEQGHVLEGECEGMLCLRDGGPGMLRTIYRDPGRFLEAYFSAFRGLYFTGDGARRDTDGYYWITGRVDDVVNVSGHRLGTVEVENALAAHPKVVEAAVIGYPHALKGQGIYAFVTLQGDVQPGAALLRDLEQWVRKEIGPIAVPDAIQWAPNLPKTRSGKIMRRLLRKIAASQASDLGDISTLADPSVLDDLVVGHRTIASDRYELPCTR